MWNKNTPSRRRSFLINPKFQLKFLCYIVGIALVTIAVFYGAKILFFYKVHDYMRSIGIPEDHIVFDFLAKQSRVMNLIFLAAAVVECSFLVAIGILLSHQVAGPMYRLREDLNKMADGSPLKEIKFRKGDYFQDVAQAFNRHLERYRSKMNATLESKSNLHD